MSWIHRGKERLFTSPRAVFRPGEAIRGGIPVIFPQFGTNGTGLRHGFARVLTWEPVQVASEPDRATLQLRESGQSKRWWPHRFHAELYVQLLEDGLSTTLTINNCDVEAFEFTAALHTYLRVSSIAQAGLVGLQGLPYIDAAKGRQPRVQRGTVLRFSNEVDRIYTNSGDRQLTLKDAASALTIGSKGFADTVVWNPGAELAANIGDLGAGNHARFVCVEAANAKSPVSLPTGATWQGTQILICVEG